MCADFSRGRLHSTLWHLLQARTSLLSFQSVHAYRTLPLGSHGPLSLPGSQAHLFLHPQTAPFPGSPTSVNRTLFPESFQVKNLSVTFNFHSPLPHIQPVSKSPGLLFPNTTQIHPGPGPIQGTQTVEAGAASAGTSAGGGGGGVSPLARTGARHDGRCPHRGRGQQTWHPLGRGSRHGTELLTDSRLLYWEDLTTHTRRE